MFPLPVDYDYPKSAYMTESIFKSWFHNSFACQVLVIPYAFAVTTTLEDENVTESFDKYIRPSSINDRTVSELMNEQTEAIKKIMSAQRSEAPILPDKESPPQNIRDYEEPIIKPEDGPFKDVKAKCEYYFKISDGRSKEAVKRDDVSKQTLNAWNVPYLYATSYGNQAVSYTPEVNSKPYIETPAPATNLVKEETEQKRYYQYVPYDLSNKPSNVIAVSNLPYFYAPSYSSQAVPAPPTTHAENQFNYKPNTASSESITSLGVLKQESSQNSYYEYAPSNKPIVPLQPLNYPNQQLQFPIYAENQITVKTKGDSSIPVTKVELPKEEILHNRYIQHVPYNFYQYPAYNIPILPQSNNIHNEYSAINNVKYQSAQASSQLDTNPDQKHVIQNPDLKYVAAPLTLQNALVSDGKTLYHWYKTMPGYQIYVNLPYSANNVPKLEEPLPESSQIHNYQSKIKYTYITQPPKVHEATTPTPTTTTTEIVPSYEVKYTVKDTPSDGALKHQLRFVYPYLNTATKSSWRVDPYGYYPKRFQPGPYIPTLYAIRTLDIPNKYVESGNVQIASKK
ncbi:hypothetical protein Trydic_g867 [Trypoxylus dichotomus]